MYMQPEQMDESKPANVPTLVGCQPVVKWAGGKRWLVPLIADPINIRLAATRGRYIEPFLGGGAVALSLGLPKMILGDCCQPLVAMYRAIAKNSQGVAWALQTLIEQGTDKETYLRIRATQYPNPAFAAARFIYLNKTGFNGLYRENSRGEYNVPYGKTSNGAKRSYPSIETISQVAAAIKTSDIAVRDFRDTIAFAKAGDVVYADPPYYDTFSDYTAEGFGDAEHVALADALREAASRGAAILASNVDHERIRELYAWAHVLSLTERHVVGAKAERRGARNAVLIVSDVTLVPDLAK